MENFELEEELWNRIACEGAEENTQSEPKELFSQKLKKLASHPSEDSHLSANEEKMPEQEKVKEKDIEEVKAEKEKIEKAEEAEEAEEKVVGEDHQNEE